MPEHVDYIDLKRELRMLSLMIFVVGVLYGLYTAVLFVDPKFHYMAYFWYLSIAHPLFSALDFWGIMTMTYQVLKWRNLLQFIASNRHLLRLASKPSVSSSRSDEKNNKENIIAVQMRYRIYQQTHESKKVDRKKQLSLKKILSSTQSLQ
ncbi:hypothetical protein RFI_33597, partial [Reticulomyxa filosa]